MALDDASQHYLASTETVLRRSPATARTAPAAALRAE
jgi:hypothetical protein